MEKYVDMPAIMGMGNALVDVINILEDDSLLEYFNLPKGSMTLVDAELSARIMETTTGNKREITTGGSAANAIHALAALGATCGYIGKIGDDVLGAAFQKEFSQKNIKTYLFLSKKETGRVMALVSLDSERTMATYLGAAANLKAGELSAEMFEGFSYLFIEGYLVQDHKLIETAIDLARSRNLAIAIDLSSYNVVESNVSFLKRIIAEKVDIVFANEEEAYAFTGKKPEEAVSELASICNIAIVKTGKNGSIIQQGIEVVRQGIVPANAVDSTGAGDAYAAGFLFGITRGYPLQRCAEIAALVAGKSVEVIGAKIPDSLWPGLLKKVNSEG
jgi:sugar/nucleoside kinase (ribokinase family)